MAKGDRDTKMEKCISIGTLKGCFFCIIAALFIIISFKTFSYTAAAADTEDETLGEDQGEAVNGSANIIGFHSENDTLSLYVKGLGELPEKDAVSAVIGTGKADVSSLGKLSDGNIELHTLVMIDNSFSIRENQRKAIDSLVQEIFSGRMDGEKMALATFSEDITYLCNYTTDYAELKSALSNLQYQNQETYLTDVLYELLNFEEKEDKEIFKRIIIISDGVDNKPIGYTKEELYDYLKNNPLPLITIGCREANNETMLKDMFALSRLTGGESFILDDIQDEFEVIKALSSYKNVARIVLKPEASVLDGSIKAVNVNLGQVNVNRDLRMPQVQQQKEEKPAEVTIVEKAPESKPVEAEKEDEKKFPIILIAGIAGAVLVLIILILIIVIVRKGKKTRKDEPVINDKQNDGGDGTIFIGEDGKVYTLIFEDVDNPAKRYVKNLTGMNRIVIKRASDNVSSPSPDVIFLQDRSVSGNHCEISVRSGVFYIRDLGSSNGTYLNERRIASETEIISGNVIKVGTTRLRVSM